VRGRVAPPQPLGEGFGIGREARRHGAETVAVEKLQTAPMDAAKSVGFLQYHLKDRSEVAGREVDDLQDFGGGGLLSERPGSLGAALGKLTLEIGYEPLGIG